MLKVTWKDYFNEYGEIINNLSQWDIEHSPNIKREGELISIENDYAYIVCDDIIVKRCYKLLNVGV